VAEIDLSIVIPVHDEEENVVLLHPRIEEACAPMGIAFEVIFVDDASRDSTWERLEALEPGAGDLVLVRLLRNCGQTPAMAAGFEHVRGRIVVTMDGDLQNDPADIPELVRLIDEGYELVCGWRKDRKDKLWTRKIPSKCANWLIRRVTRVTVHDYGCSLKAYRRELVDRMCLYSDMHRFLPFISQQSGARVGEIPVRHHARVHGQTKYGLSRIWKVLIDLFSLKVLVHYHRHLFVWFVVMSLPVMAVFAGLLYWSFHAPLESRQTVMGTTVVVGSLGIFFGVLGLVSELVLGPHREDLDRLLVIDDKTGEALT
jgi:glycosyltransferase involved in cell wall biosynthesis